ncbi:glycogen synthase [Sulfurimonas sp. SWIR-19]|uniref:glycogen synthase n=1 Tax=Sulfurimonas sp. SWIR-19 TaxID=2878390 RepID=UPI001CF15739|nr:glycogen/starch synthase [Sulfurimonas sp. SWIR-19]UCN00810.1 glycogen synthase [Sulfurimonas sp. SWIR-19]
MRVLFAASEIFPYAKTGGLADVASSLPLALQKYVQIFRVMPLYGFMHEEEYVFYDDFTVSLDAKHYPVKIFTKEDKGIVTYFVKAPHLSQTHNLYTDEHGDYKNNALRFGIFCMAIIELSIRLNCQLIHLNDWHTALVALFIQEYQLRIKTVFTIHNLAYQGIFEQSVLETLGIPSKYFTMDALEFYSKVNFLKAGIACSDVMTTVSPTYAQEIVTKEFGCGLEGFLQKHREKLVGILNGIDETVFRPLQSKKVKRQAKTEFCSRFGFEDSKLPLFIMVSRLTEQKGIDLLLESFAELQNKKLNLFILGEGEAKYTKALKEFAKKHRNFSFVQDFDEELSHQAYLASDFLLMPSRFEPCGLNQFIAMNCGSIAVVHEVGGLKDSVHEHTTACGQGISYKEQNKKEFLYAVDRALSLYTEKEKMQKIIDFNLACDFSFAASAKKYFKIYKSLL